MALEAVDPARRKVLRVFRRDRGGLRDGGTPEEQGEKNRPEKGYDVRAARHFFPPVLVPSSTVARSSPA